jgi:hypothetical protein
MSLRGILRAKTAFQYAFELIDLRSLDYDNLLLLIRAGAPLDDISQVVPVCCEQH